MKTRTNVFATMIMSLLTLGVIVNCTHKETLAPAVTPITRGEARYTNFDPADPFNQLKLKFDKTHCNVGWETSYLGELATLTGRFDTFGLSKFIFVENKPDTIQFEAWVFLNSVNTSEPGRDHGCLAGNGPSSSFGVDQSMTTEPANVAIIKSKSVVYSTTDKGYIATCDLTFHGVTKEVTAKLYYSGTKVTTAPNPTAVPPIQEKDAIGFHLEFPMNAKTDFGITSTSIADLVTIKCNITLRNQF